MCRERDDITQNTNIFNLLHQLNVYGLFSDSFCSVVGVWDLNRITFCSTLRRLSCLLLMCFMHVMKKFLSLIQSIFWKCNFPINHNVCLSLSVCPKSVRKCPKNNFITKCNIYIFQHISSCYLSRIIVVKLWLKNCQLLLDLYTYT